MTVSKTNIELLSAQLKRLKVLLVVLTLFQLVYIFMLFSNNHLWLKLHIQYRADLVVALVNFMIAAIFIWFNWKKLPLPKKKKWDNTWMIFFLGIIGMWLWMPSEKELRRLESREKLGGLP